MPTVRDHHALKIFKCMIMGDPGSGKTGALPDLINNMDRFKIERVAILDFDDGLDILLPLVKEEFYDRVFYETLVDELKATQDGVQVRTANAFTKAMGLLNNWKSPGVDLGRALEWGPETLLVLDSITGIGDACMGFVNVHLKMDDDWKATGEAMKRQGKLVQMTKSLGCHIIIMSHIRFMGGGGTRAVVDKHGQKSIEEVNSRVDGDAYPSCLGKVLPPTVGRHFNTILEVKLVGKNRRLRTVPEERMNLKVPLLNLPDELPQETGLTVVFDKFLNR